MVGRGSERGEKFASFFPPLNSFSGMNAEVCVSHGDMTSMDSYYSPSAAQGRDHPAEHFGTFQAADTKYSPSALLPAKGQAYGEKSRSPFQQECQSLDAAAAGQDSFSKYHLFMHRSSCKTPPEESKLHPESGRNGALVSCYGECAEEHFGGGGVIRVAHGKVRRIFKPRGGAETTGAGEMFSCVFLSGRFSKRVIYLSSPRRSVPQNPQMRPECY